jgi:hypothetical protein
MNGSARTSLAVVVGIVLGSLAVGRLTAPRASSARAEPREGTSAHGGIAESDCDPARERRTLLRVHNPYVSRVRVRAGEAPDPIAEVMIPSGEWRPLAAQPADGLVRVETWFPYGTETRVNPETRADPRGVWWAKAVEFRIAADPCESLRVEADGVRP